MAKDTLSRFQRWLHRWLKEKNLTNVEASVLLDVNDSLIGHYLKGTREPSYKTLAKIRQVTGVDLNTLFPDPE